MSNNAAIIRKVYRLQLDLVRKLNDAHIFIHQALPLLRDARDSYKASRHSKDRDYFVPSIKKNKVARRKDVELKEIYDRFISKELFENFIINAISQFESFIFEVLKQVIKTYPKKLTQTIQGVETYKQVPIDIILGSDNLDSVLNALIERRLHTISYAAPRAYLEYFREITGVEVSDSAFNDYIEMKAARDLLIHNSGIINEVYLSKAEAKKRGEEGVRIPIDAEYFDHCISTLKRLSGIVKRDIETAFPDRQKDVSNSEA